MYKLKGKIKKFLEMKIVGEDKMGKQIISELLTANDGSFENIDFSYQNRSYKVVINENNLDLPYIFERDNSEAFKFAFDKDKKDFIFKIGSASIAKDRLYKAWKELV